jgi:hypothetical protein
MADITRADITNAINSVTGNPTSGIVADVTPAIVDAIDKLINPKAETEQRVIKAAETRKADTPSA